MCVSDSWCLLAGQSQIFLETKLKIGDIVHYQQCVSQDTENAMLCKFFSLCTIVFINPYRKKNIHLQQ